MQKRGDSPPTTHRTRIIALEHGELWVAFPDEVLKKAGLSDGDEMIMEIGDSEIKLRKAP